MDFNPDFGYAGVEYDYHEYYSCDESCDGICRCGEIRDTEVTEVNLTEVCENVIRTIETVLRDRDRAEKAKATKAAKAKAKAKGVKYTPKPKKPPFTLSALDRYGIERIVARQNLNADSFEIEVGPGYYGEEIDGVHLDYQIRQNINAEVEKYLKLKADPSVRIPHLLMVEYGYLLETLEGRSFKITDVPLDSVKFGASNHYQHLDQGAVSGYADRLKSEMLADLPLGVALSEGGFYRLIDGYHRLRAAQEAGFEKVRVAVAK